MWFLLILPSMATAAPKPSSSSPSSDGSSSLAGLATGFVLGLAFAPQPDCRDVGVRILKRRKTHQRQMNGYCSRSMPICALFCTTRRSVSEVVLSSPCLWERKASCRFSREAFAGTMLRFLTDLKTITL